jgi:hypothetical protein
MAVSRIVTKERQWRPTSCRLASSCLHSMLRSARYLHSRVRHCAVDPVVRVLDASIRLVLFLVIGMLVMLLLRVVALLP